MYLLMYSGDAVLNLSCMLHICASVSDVSMLSKLQIVDASDTSSLLLASCLPVNLLLILIWCLVFVLCCRPMFLIQSVHVVQSLEQLVLLATL
jgi:hypothetical protein